MIRTNGFLGFLVFSLILLSSSCRKEESVTVGNTPDERLVGGSNVANLLVRLATNDGSDDNIIDGASCISLRLPITVNINGTAITVDGPEDFETIEDILDNTWDEDGGDDVDYDDDKKGQLEIVFPVTAVFADYSETVIGTDDELRSAIALCQTSTDTDIECIDILYPINVSFFDTVSELFGSVSLNNDDQLFKFFKELDVSSVADIDFPISVVLKEGTEIEVVDLVALENVIDMSKDDCDENDDNDFDDDDCDDCNNEKLLELWAGCSEWTAHKFKLDGKNIKKDYDGLVLEFRQNGTVYAFSDTDIFDGTWATSGSANSMTFVLEITGLDAFNGTWDLTEIKEKSTKFDIRLRRDGDELHIQSPCSDND